MSASDVTIETGQFVAVQNNITRLFEFLNETSSHKRYIIKPDVVSLIAYRTIIKGPSYFTHTHIRKPKLKYIKHPLITKSYTSLTKATFISILINLV